MDKGLDYERLIEGECALNTTTKFFETKQTGGWTIGTCSKLQ